MTTRFISLATAIVLLDVYLRSRISSNDPLFLFASNSLPVNLGLLMVASLMMAVSFKTRFKHWWSYVAVAAAAVFLGFVGMIGGFFSDTFYWFPQALLPLDYLFLLEAGVVFGICALSYKHQSVPYKVKLPQITANLLNRLAFPVLKIPHSPQAGRARRVQHA